MQKRKKVKTSVTDLAAVAYRFYQHLRWCVGEKVREDVRIYQNL